MTRMKRQLPDSAVSADAAAAPAVGAAGSVVAAVAAGPTVGCAVGGQPVNKNKQSVHHLKALLAAAMFCWLLTIFLLGLAFGLSDGGKLAKLVTFLT